MKIESLTNIHVKHWVKLREKKYRDESGLFLIEGDHLLNEALQKGVVKEIVSNDSSWKKENIPFYEVTPAILKKISHQISSTKVVAVCEKVKEKTIKGNICILDCIQDPGNLGTIIRSCVAFGIDTLVVSQDTVDVYNEKVIRASEGLFFHLNIVRKNLPLFLEEIKKDDYLLLGTDVKNGKCLESIEINKKYAILMGNEGKGVQKALASKCNEMVNISMSNSCESLNVAVATSIILYSLNNRKKALK